MGCQLQHGNIAAVQTLHGAKGRKVACQLPAGAKRIKIGCQISCQHCEIACQLPASHASNRKHTKTRTCAAASGTIPVRLCKGPRLGPRWTFGARRPKLDRCLCGHSCNRWRNPVCAAFPPGTPTARVAKQSADVLPCGPAPHHPTLDDASVNTTL